jgi:hypothetical protein
MSGGFLLGLDGGLYDHVAAMLIKLGAVAAVDDLEGRVVQLTDEAGRLFTLYERVPIGTEWEVRGGPVAPAAGVRVPDLHRVTACPFECRWPDLVARLAEMAAAVSESPIWVLDGDGVVWGADAVDPLTVRL